MLDLGYRGMVTRAYDKNDSPAFFERIGGRIMGKCVIPNDYLAADGGLSSVNIPGVWLYWSRQAMQEAAGKLSLAFAGAMRNRQVFPDRVGQRKPEM
jgi:hypothetical protein